jgi:inosose dehydratase
VLMRMLLLQSKKSTTNYLRGAIFGHGDIDVRMILKTIKQSGYEGYISLEFEGLEDCLPGSRTDAGLSRQAKKLPLLRLWDPIDGSQLI